MMHLLKNILAGATVLAGLALAPNASAGLMTFDIKWSGTGGASAIATLTLDSALIRAVPFTSDVIRVDQLQNLVVTVAGAQFGNGTYGKADFSAIGFYTASALNLQQQLIGQMVTLHQFSGGQDFTYQAPYGVNDDGRTGAFNLFGAIDSAPHTVAPFGIITDDTQPTSDFMQVTSILARAQVSAVPEPDTNLLVLAGLGVVLVCAGRARGRPPRT